MSPRKPVRVRKTAVTIGIALVAVPLGLLVGLLPGCEGPPNRDGHLVRDSAGVTVVENTRPRWGSQEGWTVDPTPTLDLGGLRGDSAFQFFQVAGAVTLPDGRLAVVNNGSGEIRFFDRTGRVLGATGQKGDGPGEFQDLFFLRKIRGDSLMAYDWRLRRISILSPQGEFARLFQVTVLTTSGGFPVVAEPLPGGDLLLATDMFLATGSPQPGARRDSAVYYILDPDGSVARNLGAFPGGESYETMDGDNWVGGGLVFGRYGYATVSGDGFYYGSSDRFEIEYRDRTGQLQRILRLDQPNLEVTQEDIRRYVDDRLENARDERRREIYRTMFEHMPFPDVMPAYGEFLVDSEGDLWVQEYRKPGDDQPRWKVFDPQGVYLGVVDTPPRFQIYEIGPDYLLGRWPDDLDVEHVRKYELVKG